MRLISFEKKLGGNGNVDGKKAVQQLFKNSEDYFLILEILDIFNNRVLLKESADFGRMSTFKIYVF